MKAIPEYHFVVKNDLGTLKWIGGMFENILLTICSGELPLWIFQSQGTWNENNEMKILYEGPSFEDARNMYCNPTQSKETDHEKESCVS